MDGRKKPGGAEKARLKKRKTLDCCKMCQAYRFIFKEDKHNVAKWQLVLRDIDLMISPMISISKVIIRLISL